MTEQLPAVLVVGPLISAFIIAAAGFILPSLCFSMALAGMLSAFGSAVALLPRVLYGGHVAYNLGGWPPPIGIAYYVDGLNGPVLTMVSGVALANLLASRRYVEERFVEKRGAFYALYALMVSGLLGIVVTGDAFNLYVVLEIAALSGYGLLAMDGPRSTLSTLNYLFLGTIGASFYLLGVGYIYILTGSLNMLDVARLLPPLFESKALLGGFAIMMVGLMLKMALFPLHTWLPNAYTYAVFPSTTICAALVTKVMVYVMIRFILTVFTPSFSFITLDISDYMVWLSTAAIIAGAFLALGERDFKRMLTYIIISEVGYMFGGAWMGNRTAMTGAVLHILNDGIMTLAIFMAAGNIFYRLGTTSISQFSGLFSKMPYTAGALVLAALSIVGVPPTCGFFSKWYLLLGAYQEGHYLYMGALIFSSLVNLALLFRIIESAYYGSFSGHSTNHQRAEAPLSMLLPLILVGASLIAVGLMAGAIVGRVIQYAIPGSLG
jgi:multicomponent Na+:H+ antiporter subunit D